MANVEEYEVAPPSTHSPGDEGRVPPQNEIRGVFHGSQADVHMTAQTTQRAVHLVGSVPLADAETVFRTVSSILGENVRRIPDGETGVRLLWINWQVDFLTSNPSLELASNGEKEYGRRLQIRLRANADSDTVAIDNLGYADAAIASYQTFARLKREGVIAATTRFLVSLPTPFATVMVFIELPSQSAVEPPYEAQMLAEVDCICATIPHDQLAIQWDTPVEFAYWEGAGWGTYLDNVRSGVIDRLVRLGKHVPPDVELGYHLCYGDLGHKHFVEPKDTGTLVIVANEISARVARPINFVHMPVPRDRDDEAYFAPLTNLKLHGETEIYLGLVHYTDGVAGALRRIAVAQRFLRTFGIATECGLGRRPVETITHLLEIHRNAAKNTN